MGVSSLSATVIALLHLLTVLLLTYIPLSSSVITRTTICLYSSTHYAS